MGLFSLLLFLVLVCGAPPLLIWLSRRIVPERYAGVALGALVLIAAPVFYMLVAEFELVSFVTVWVGGLLLVAWLVHRFVPARYARLTFGALLLIAVGAFAIFQISFPPAWEAFQAGEGPQNPDAAAAPLRLLMLIVLGSLYLSIAFVPSFFKAHGWLWAALYAPVPLALDFALMWYMGLTLSCSFHSSCP